MFKLIAHLIFIKHSNSFNEPHFSRRIFPQKEINPSRYLDFQRWKTPKIVVSILVGKQMVRESCTQWHTQVRVMVEKCPKHWRRKKLIASCLSKSQMKSQRNSFAVILETEIVVWSLNSLLRLFLLSDFRQDAIHISFSDLLHHNFKWRNTCISVSVKTWQSEIQSSLFS